MSHFHVFHGHLEHNHGFNGYKDVIDSIMWGLERLGHTVSYSRDSYSPDFINIIFGGHTLISSLFDCPKGSIIYNMEQVRGFPQYQAQAEHVSAKFMTSQFRIWDYSSANMETWNGHQLAYPALHVPVAYAPILSRIEKPAYQDIDVLIYGSVGPERMDIFRRLSKANLSVVYACGLYGQERDSLIARSKVILNINHFTQSRIFEIVRVSYLMANRKAIVSDIHPETSIESDIVSGLIFADADSMVDTCRQLVMNEEGRQDLEERAFQAFSARRIELFLSYALYNSFGDGPIQPDI